MKRTLYKNVLNCGGAFNCVFANGTNRSTHERVKKNIHKLLFLCFFLCCFNIIQLVCMIFIITAII